MENSPSFRKTKNKNFQPPNLELDSLIDSGAESNIIMIPTWIENHDLHPKLLLLKTSSKLATSQGISLTKYGTFQLLLITTRTREQSKFISKSSKRIFHITNIKHNIAGVPFITTISSQIHSKQRTTN